MRTTTVALRYVLIATFALVMSAAGAQPVEAPPLTLEALFASPTYAPKYFEGGRWAEEGPVLRYVDSDADAGTTSLVELNLETDDRRTLIDGTALRNPDATGEDDALIQIEDYAYSPDGAKVLIYTDSERVWRLNTKGYYYVYDLPTGRVSAIAPRADGFQMFAKFDPAGRRVAFVRDRDLWVTDVTTGAVRRLTDTGSEGGIINGTFDWVYEEEFGLRDGFRWSPDGEHIAFFQLDETATRDFQVTNYTTLYPEYQTFRYPKVGEMNSEVRIGLVDPSTGAIRYFDTDTWYEGPEGGRRPSTARRWSG
jgi:dipeptidyl-peptidase-4